MTTILPFAILLLFQGVLPPAKPAPDAVLATLDGKPITAAEIEPYLWSWKVRDVLREYADHRMILEAAAQRGLVATDAEVKARLDLQLAAASTGLPAGGTVEDVLQARGLNVAHLAILSRSAVLLDKITESEYKPGGFVKFQALVVPVADGTPDALAKAQRKADLAYAALQTGKPWETVLKANEKDPNAIPAGGLVGWRSLDLFPENLRAAFGNLKPGGFSRPVQTPKGIGIFRLIARGEAATPEETATLKRQFVEKSRSVVLQRLRAATKIEIK